MKIISQHECSNWIKTNLGGDMTLETVEVNYAHYLCYLVPSDTGKKTTLARVLVSSLEVKSPGLLWITGYGIWPSSENMALFDGYRKSLGDSRSIHEAPGHVFEDLDLVQLEALLDLALYFYWDATLFDGRIAVKISHDEYISLHAKDRDSLSQIERNLAGLKLKQLAADLKRSTGD